MMINLKQLQELSVEHIENCSNLVNELDGEEKFNCTGVYGLTNQELDAFFSGIRKEWKEWEELHNFIEMETLEEELRRPIYEYLQEQKIIPPDLEKEDKAINNDLEPKISKDTKKRKWIIATAVSLTTLVGLIILPYFTKSRLEANSITIGTLWTPEAQTELSNYLEEKLVPKNFIDFLKGEKIEIIINGDKTLPYQTAQNRISNYQWDIAFTNSPVISIFAKDSDYKFVAVMFPDSEVYQSGLIVHPDSSIQSIDDIQPKHTIALGSLGRSASSFFMPVYDLYGKTLNVDYGNRGSAIKEMVKSGEVDLGAVAITSFDEGIQGESNSDWRLIHQSRNIPSSAVYLSPGLSDSDQETLNKVLLNAPQGVKKFENSNYGVAVEPDFSEFRKVIDRVNTILICSDFSENPVSLFCPEGIEIKTITGEVNGWTAKNNSVLLKLVERSGEIYNVNIDREVLEQATGLDTPEKLQSEIIEIKISKQKILKDNGISIININQTAQLNLL
jgi:serine/threonine-protein kinase